MTAHLLQLQTSEPCRQFADVEHFDANTYGTTSQDTTVCRQQAQSLALAKHHEALVHQSQSGDTIGYQVLEQDDVFVKTQFAVDCCRLTETSPRR